MQVAEFIIFAALEESTCIEMWNLLLKTKGETMDYILSLVYFKF